MLSSQLVIAPLKVAKIKCMGVKGKRAEILCAKHQTSRNIFTDLQRTYKSLCSCKRKKTSILLAQLSLKQWDSVQYSLKKHSFHSCDFRNCILDFTHGSSPGRLLFFTRLNRMADGSLLKERATSHRSLPDSWVNRKEIFPCLPWLKLSADLCLVFLSTWLNTGTGPVWEEPEGSSKSVLWCVGCDTPPCSPQLFAGCLTLSSRGLNSSEEPAFRSVSVSPT